MHKRLAKEIARIESKYENSMSEEKIYDLIKNFRYIIPQGGPMTGIGNNYQIASLSNCFVIGDKNPADSYGGIMKIDQEQVQLMKRRGGVGHDLSHIRPDRSPVYNSALTSTGVVPFMERYSNSTREVAQDGRRGALMLSIGIQHPDAEKFIDAKMESGKITGANVSVKIDDKFMEAVENGKKYTQQYPIDSKNPTITKKINAVGLWKKIVHNAWKSAEPGILFWDTIVKESVPDSYSDLGYKTVSTNPCGEIPLCPYDSCRLLAINLFNYVEKPFTPEAKFNFDLFKEHTGYAQRIMDDIIDLELEKIDAILNKVKKDPEDDEVKRVEINLWNNIRHKAEEGRRTGVGITAEGDMLAALGLKYGSEDAISFSTEVHKGLALAAYRASVDMAKERGAFGVYDWKKEKDNPFINRIKEADSELYEDMKTHGRRNIALLTIAPTGTTSLMSQTTSGIEPVFMPVYKRRRKVNPNDKDVTVSFVDEVGDSWEEHSVFHHKFVDWMITNCYNTTKKYSDEEMEELIEKSPYYKASSNDVDWVSKVKMQGAIQKWIDHSISVTVNLPENATEEIVGQVYMEGWKAGCKGITVYRDGSRNGVLTRGKEKGLEGKIEGFPKKRPEKLEADVVRFNNNNGKNEKWIAVVGTYDGRPYEIFTGLNDLKKFPLPEYVQKGKIIKVKDEQGKSRYDFEFIEKHGYTNTLGGLSNMFNKEFWNYAKLISGVLRHGMPVENVVDLVKGLKIDEEDHINTWKNGIERALKKYIPDGTKAKNGECEECHSTELIYEEGCLKCCSCGNSKCGG
jgi:ribonucleoside-diphosphate reductase alpha chain